MGNFALQQNHFLVKAMGKTNIKFPISKIDAIKEAGDVKVKTGPDTYTSLAKIIENMDSDNGDYPNGSAFMTYFVKCHASHDLTNL